VTGEDKRKNEKGHLMVAVMVMIAIMAIGQAKVARSWVDIKQREDEAEMMFRAQEIARAIVKYRADRGNQPLTELEQLMEPGTKGQYFLRKLYDDPLVRDGKWGLLYQGPNNSVIDPSSPDVGTLAMGDSRPLTPMTGPGSRTSPTAGEISGLPIIGVKSLCDKKPFRVHKNLREYSEWQFTVYDFLNQGRQQAGQDRQGPGQRTNIPQAGSAPSSRFSRRILQAVIRRETLPNGLTLLTESMPHVRSVSLGVWLRLGSRHEKANVNGISHFIEHLVFKGTETRTAREIALTADSVGMQLDAFTTKEYTCFYAKMLDEHLPRAVDLLADIVQHPQFDPEELERERQVVMEEIRMVEDTPDELIYDLFSSHFYPTHPLGRPIQGTEETVGAMTRRRLLGFFRRAYRPENMLIVAAGNLKHAELRRMVKKAFRGMEAGNGTAAKLRPPRARGGIVKRQKKELEQLHLLLGLPAYPEDYADRYALFVLNALLGGTMSSRLFQKIREERGLVYSVYSGLNAFMDCGFMMVAAATSPKRGEEVVRLTLAEMDDLRRQGPGSDELRVAKEHLKGSLMLALESTSSRMSNLARQEIYFGRQLTLAEILRRIDAVTTDHVRDLSEELFDDRELSLAAVGELRPFRMTEAALRL
jgi:predicted Zn-dependent peptidase/type II secretory pathway pseudopilin PulG